MNSWLKVTFSDFDILDYFRCSECLFDILLSIVFSLFDIVCFPFAFIVSLFHDFLFFPLFSRR